MPTELVANPQSFENTRRMQARAAPTLQTKRLILALPRAEDAHQLHAYALRNHEHLAPWSPPAPADWRQFAAYARLVERIAREYESGQCVRFWLRPGHSREGKLIGAVTLGVITLAAFRACYLGYHIDREHEGQGYMTEAVSAAIAYAFDELKLHRIMANYLPHNQRSEKLLARLGFVKEGYAKDYLFIAGKWQDHVLTSLTNQRLENAAELVGTGV